MQSLDSFDQFYTPAQCHTTRSRIWLLEQLLQGLCRYEAVNTPQSKHEPMRDRRWKKSGNLVSSPVLPPMECSKTRCLPPACSKMLHARTWVGLLSNQLWPFKACGASVAGSVINLLALFPSLSYPFPFSLTLPALRRPLAQGSVSKGNPDNKNTICLPEL